MATGLKVHGFTVGPILGYVEPDRARIFGRGRLEWLDDSDDHTRAQLGPRRCFGAVRWRARNSGAQFGAPVFFPMKAHFDLTGIGILSGLGAEREYEYQAGWFFSERGLRNPLGSELLDWRGVGTQWFRTAAKGSRQQRSYVFGSCRYMLRLFGGLVFEGRGDKTFESVYKQMRDRAGTPKVQTDGLIMLGDQIYADDLNVIGADDQVDEFLERYRAAFGQEHIRRLMASVPTYMTLDDHEIEDNWPHKADPKDYQVKYPAAIHAYSIYQVSHSPLGKLNRAGNRLASLPNRFWYSFSDGCCDFFVLDVRTERDADSIIGHEQMRALKSFLTSGRNTAKVIVSSVPIFPDFKTLSDDKWSGFLAQRDELLNFIHDRKVRRVVTLSGDVHSSMAVELVSDADPEFRILSVVSSPLYWPYPHPSRKSFQLQGRLASNSPYGYRLTGGHEDDVTTTENFTRLTVAPEGAEVTVYGRKGKQIGRTRSFPFSRSRSPRPATP